MEVQQEQQTRRQHSAAARTAKLTQHLTSSDAVSEHGGRVPSSPREVDVGTGPVRKVQDRVDYHSDNVVDRVLESLDINGYVVLENFVSEDKAAEILAKVRPLLAVRPTGRQAFEGVKTKRLNSVFAKTDAFVDVLLDDKLLETTKEVLKSEHFITSVAQVIEILPGEKHQAPHRDDAMFPVERPHDEFVLSTMLALTEFTAENGATRLYPGSHKWKAQPKARAKEVITKGMGVRKWDDDRLRDLEENGKPISATMKPGSMLLYYGSILHGGGTNNADESRLGFALHFIQGWLQPQERMLLAVPRKIMRTYPDKLQKLLGWNVWPAFGGAIDGEHPQKVLQTDEC